MRDAELPEWIARFSRADIAALFANPKIEGGFLADFLKQNDVWAALDEDRQQHALLALSANSRIKADYDGPMDGWAEYRHGSVFDHAWQLALKVPVTEQWAVVLGHLYEHLYPRAHGIDDLIAAASRWHPQGQAAAEEAPGHLSRFELMRAYLCRLVLGPSANSSQKTAELLASDDRALRAGAFMHAWLSAADIRVAAQKDPELFDEMLWNERLWWTKDRRDVLHEIAWAPERDPNHRLDDANMYRAMEKRMRVQHPDWFKDDEPEDESDEPDGPPVVAQSVVTPELVGELQRDIARLMRRTMWLGWGVAAILALIWMNS